MAVNVGERLPESITELAGVTRAAILMVSLDKETAAAAMTHLPEESLAEIAREVASLGPVPANLRHEVIEEFYGLVMASQYMNEGGIEYARSLLLQSLDGKTADKIISQIQTQVQKTPFSFLQKAQSDNLLTFIQEEHPQTIALIVSHLPHHKASEILVGLPAQKQVEVIKRIANMDQTNPEVIRTVEAALEGRLSSMLGQASEKTGGIPTVAEILNLADRSTEKAILEGIETEDPDLVEEIRRLMFVFEDVVKIDDKGIQAVLKEIDNDELSLALKTASEELSNKIFGNMSDRAAELVKEDMEYMGPVRVSDVEAAQQRIVDVVRRLEDSGVIVIASKGAEGELIV